MTSAKPNICPRCGNASTIFDKKTGFCINCCREVDITQYDDKKSDHIQFEISGIQKSVQDYKGRDYIVYKIEIPKSMNWWVKEVGRKNRFRINIRLT